MNMQYLCIQSKPDVRRRAVRPGSPIKAGTRGAPPLLMLDSETAKDLIRPHMAVVCSENHQFGTVDHVEGHNSVKLTKDDTGQHHYIPLTWITSVDDKVHVDRPGKQAMQEWSTAPLKQ
jgi:hypothetical protein